MKSFYTILSIVKLYETLKLCYRKIKSTWSDSNQLSYLYAKSLYKFLCSCVARDLLLFIKKLYTIFIMDIVLWTYYPNRELGVIEHGVYLLNNGLESILRWSK